MTNNMPDDKENMHELMATHIMILAYHVGVVIIP